MESGGFTLNNNNMSKLTKHTSSLCMAESDERHLVDLVGRERAERIYGVFSAPIQEKLLDTHFAAVHRGDFTGTEVPCFSAWNVSRTVDGGKPTFHHQRFCLVGHI